MICFYFILQVRTISVQSALLRNPYILFYEMIERPKDIPGMKQVIRQSSAKALIRQDSSDGSSKPLPTSHSTSCVSNGIGRASDDGVGDVVGRSAANHHSSKSPIKFSLTSQKERLISGLSKPSTSSGSKTTIMDSKTNRITLHSNNTNLLALKNSGSTSHDVTSISSASVARKLMGEKSPSLVPYPDDSDDSEIEENKKVVNGCISKSSENVAVGKKDKGACPKNRMEKMNGSLRDVTSDHDKMVNGVVKEAKINGSGPTLNGESSSSKSGESSINNSCSSNSNGKLQAPFVPRALQVQSNLKNRSSSPLGNNSKCSDGGWVVSETTSNPVENERKVEVPSRKMKEKVDSRGWTVTRTKPELEKSRSHDSVLPGMPRKDEDAASLESKTSVDSYRSDRSNKSVKKSLLSFFPCMSATLSPDTSPQDEEQKRHIGDANHAKSSDCEPSAIEGKRLDESSKKSVTTNGDKESDSDSDATQTKRFRDDEDTGPASPSKKCRPEDGTKRNGHGSSKSDRKSENGHGRDWPEKKPNFESEPNKRKSHKSENDENFSMEEKKSRHKMKHKRNSKFSDSSDSEDDRRDFRVNGEKNGFGKARLNPDLTVVHWDQSRTDISKSLGSSKNVVNGRSCREDGRNGYDNSDDANDYENSNHFKSKNKSNGIWDGSKSTSVVDELRRAGNYGLGSKSKLFSLRLIIHFKSFNANYYWYIEIIIYECF